MRPATQPIRSKNANATDNQYTALISDVNSDSEIDSVHSISRLFNTDSEVSTINHQVYQASVLEEIRILKNQLGYIQEEDSDDNSYDDKDTMIINLAALKVLCSSSLKPLKELSTIQVQQVNIFIINSLIRVASETHDHGHGYVLETEEYFKQQMGDPKATLPTTPVRPSESLAASNHKKFCWENTIYNTYMEVERAVIVILTEVFPKSLVGLEVMPGLLPPNLKSKKALTYIQKLAKDPRNDHDTILTLKESSSQVWHTPSAQGCTVTFQELEGI